MIAKLYLGRTLKRFFNSLYITDESETIEEVNVNNGVVQSSENDSGKEDFSNWQVIRNDVDASGCMNVVECNVPKVKNF